MYPKSLIERFTEFEFTFELDVFKRNTLNLHKNTKKNKNHTTIR